VFSSICDPERDLKLSFGFRTLHKTDAHEKAR